MGPEQRQFQRMLQADTQREFQQLVRGKAVDDAAVGGKGKVDAEGLTDLLQSRAVLRGLFGACAVFLGNVFGQVLPLGGHVGVQLERLPAHARAHAGRCKRLFQLAKSDDAPRAHDVRNDVDLNDGGYVRGAHGEILIWGEAAFYIMHNGAEFKRMACLRAG